MVERLALGLGLLAACGGPTPPDEPGVFVLGVDGLDPVILQRMMDEGKLPNFKKLAAQGTFQSLATSNPPQSPVAWSTFVTGTNPGGHGIYDFVHRDPATYFPISSATGPVDPGDAIEFFGYYLPIGGDTPENNRGGTPFWDPLQAAGVDVEVYRIPGNYPPTPSDAKVLSGMGTVDMRGGYGVYTWMTDQPVPSGGHLKGDIQLVSVTDDDLDGDPDTVRGTLKGPPDLFHMPPGHIPSDSDYLTAGVTIWVDPEEDVALIDADGERALLRAGEWSDWVTLNFDGLPWGLMPMEGVVRFYLRSVRPGFELYASPVNISAASPAQDIATPSDFATELYDILGHYYTQGMPEDTNALKDHIFDDDDYASQVALVREDEDRMMDLALTRFAHGDMTFFYVSAIDLQCHMLWRLGDPKYPDAPPHPAFEADAAVDHGHDIEGYYEHTDALLGEAMSRLPEDALLMVMSDHGFQPYTREVHLNAWLRDHGYLTLEAGKTTGTIPLGDVDWSKTKAYGLGFNGLYVNMKGREAQGIVDPSEADALLAEISRELIGWHDPETDRHPIRRTFTRDEAYHGARLAEAPDLVIGYDKGYGCSDASTLGEITEATLEDNTSRWSGNHLMDPEVVPGVLLVNRALATDGHALQDVTATVLAHYGLPLPEGMEGQSFVSE